MLVCLRHDSVPVILTQAAVPFTWPGNAKTESTFVQASGQCATQLRQETEMEMDSNMHGYNIFDTISLAMV